jgi:hypothetical protein
MKHAVNLTFTKCVRIAQSRRHAFPDPHDLTRGERSLMSKGPQIDAINELEDHVRALGLEPVIEDVDQVSVVKVPSDARFACEELAISSFTRAMRVKHLQTPTAFGAVIARPHHFKRIGSAAASDLADHPILVDRLRDRARPVGHSALPLDVFFRSMSSQYLRVAA